MRVLVTGGAGFIGSHIVERLLADGHEVGVIDNLSTGKRENVPSGCDLFELDIRDEALAEVFESFRPEVVSHQAAQVDIRASVANPAFDAEVNIVGSLRLFEHCREFGTSQVVFASTGGAIYGEQCAFPADETHRTNPESPYGIAKLAVEKYLAFYSKTYGITTSILRYANVYGPRQNPHGEAGVVAIFCNKMLAGEAPTITGDGGQTRDFVYVSDVVSAHAILCAEKLSGTYNVGLGVEIDVNTVFSTIAAALEFGSSAQRGPQRAGEQRRSVISSTRLQETAAWKPEIPFALGIANTVKYFQETSHA